MLTSQMSHKTSHKKSRLLTTVTALSLALGVARVAGAQPLRRDLNDYFIFAERTVSLKNMKLDTAANVGVNCDSEGLGGNCGHMSFENIDFADGSQIVSDYMLCSKPGATAFEVFRNTGPALGNLTVRQPPISSFTTPIIPNSCGPGCNPDVSMLAAQCKFPDPFPPCDNTKPIVVNKNADCIGATDTVPGNHICDLPPGRYGDIRVRNYGNLAMSAGEYQFCSFATGKYVHITGESSVLDIDGGDMNVSDQGVFGANCGDFKVRLRGTPTVVFGHRATVSAFLCAPGGLVRLGDTNTLIGAFVGDQVVSDHDNVGRSCNTCATGF